MATPPTFPSLAGQGWSIHKKPSFATVIASHTSGREVRTALYQNPVWDFELTFSALASDTANYPALGAQSLQSLMGLFLQLQGQWSPFLYVDPTDNSVNGQTLAVGDGTTTTFTCVRTLGGFVEPVGWVTAVSQVTFNGVAQGSGWTLTTPNSLAFSIAPGAGVTVAASFTYAFLCRFAEDAIDFENFMAALWQAQSVKFRSVRPQ